MTAKHVHVKDGYEQKLEFLLAWAEGKQKDSEKA